MSEVVSIICFLILFVIILWIHNYSKRNKRENREKKEAFWGKITKFFRGVSNTIRHHVSEGIRRAQELARAAWEQQTLNIQRLIRERERLEKERKLRELANQWRTLLLLDFNNIDLVPPEVKDRLIAELEAAKERRRIYLEKEELKRKRNGYKVIVKLQELVKKLPDNYAYQSMKIIMDGMDGVYQISNIKGDDIKNSIKDHLNKFYEHPDINAKELSLLVSLLREYNCNGDQWCFQNEAQWKYSRE